MDAKNDPFKTGMEQLNALMGMWGAPMASGKGMIDVPMKRLQQFASDVQKACGDAYSGQMQAVMSGNDRLARSFQDLLGSRQPREVLAAESEILATFLEGASLHAKRWAELTQKLQECCAAMARDAAEDLRQEAHEAAAATGSGEPEQPAVKRARRESAHA
jgi:hypothetical protein